jgi:hypothetical protein
MIVLGADTHKRSHTIAAVSARTGELMGERTVQVGVKGFDALVVWARELGTERVWALEDCRHVSGSFERFLIASRDRDTRPVAYGSLVGGGPAALAAFGRRCGGVRLDGFEHQIKSEVIGWEREQAALTAIAKHMSRSNGGRRGFQHVDAEVPQEARRDRSAGDRACGPRAAGAW